MLLPTIVLPLEQSQGLDPHRLLDRTADGDIFQDPVLLRYNIIVQSSPSEPKVAGFGRRRRCVAPHVRAAY